MHLVHPYYYDYDPYMDCDLDYRQSYERESTSGEPTVTMTAELKDSEDEEFNKRKVKVINIGPDPPLCYKRYIWGRKSKTYLLFLMLSVLLPVFNDR